MASQLQQISDQVPPRRGLHLKEITTEGTADTLGGFLRATRVRKGEDLKAAARSTKIKPEYLEALEEGKIDLLPGRTYAIGFLRAYATYLGLDHAECIARFKTEHAPATSAPEPTLGFDEKKEPESGLQVSGTVLVLIGLVIVALIWGGIYLFRSANETMDKRGKAQATTAAQHHTAPAQTDAAGATPANTQTTSPAATTPAPVTDAAAEAPAITTPGTPKAKSATGNEAQDVSPPSDEEETPAAPTTANAATAQPKTPAPAPQTAASGLAPTTGAPASASGEPAPVTFDLATTQAPHSYGVASTPGRLVLRATEKVFVRIATTGARQQVVYQGQLAKGDVFYVPAMDDLVLVTRNGGALDVYLDKTLKGPVGPKGVALSGLALAPESFEH